VATVATATATATVRLENNVDDEETGDIVESDDESSISLFKPKAGAKAHSSVKLPRMTSTPGFDAEADLSVDVDELTLGKVIGAGNFSKVYDAMYKGLRVAVKKQQLQEANLDKYMAQELEVLKTISHPHLLRYMGAALVGKIIYVVTEFMKVVTYDS